jgi:hypothetical protein
LACRAFAFVKHVLGLQDKARARGQAWRARLDYCWAALNDFVLLQFPSSFIEKALTQVGLLTVARRVKDRSAPHHAPHPLQRLFKDKEALGLCVGLMLSGTLLGVAWVRGFVTALTLYSAYSYMALLQVSHAWEGQLVSQRE